MAKLLRPGTNVAIFGDSHMEALGPRLRRELPALGLRLTHVEARRGWSTRRYLRSGDIPALTRGADVVIVELGGNDAAAHIGPEGHASDVQQVIQEVAPAKVIWVGPGVTLREDLERYRGPIRRAQRRVVEGAGGAWIDSQSLTRPGDLRSDQVHFSASGYDHWTQELVPKLMSARSGGDLQWVGPIAVGVSGLIAFGAWLWTREA